MSSCVPILLPPGMCLHSSSTHVMYKIPVCRYLSMYESHRSLLDGSASAELDKFLKEEQDLEYIGKVHTYIHTIRNTV